MYHPESHIVYAAKGSDVRDLMVGGKWLVRNRQLQSLNLNTVLDQVRAECAHIRKWRAHHAGA
jgi:5-methylthioadenosine/S-adenosylhomocysteine deaminase